MSFGLMSFCLLSFGIMSFVIMSVYPQSTNCSTNKVKPLNSDGGVYLEGKAAEGDDLVEEDPVAPDVGHRGEETVGQTLRGHPPHRQHA